MLHRLRQIIDKCDELYTLSEVIELDEGFISTETDRDEKDQPLKRGRGSQKKSKVLVTVESKLVEEKPPRQANPGKLVI